jgi:hypothetical protein
MLWNVPAVNGFCPLQTRALKTLLGEPQATRTVIEFGLQPALDLLGARYILTPRDSIPRRYEHVARVQATNIYRNRRAMPAAFIVHRAELVEDTQAVDMLRSPEFDYAGLLLLHDTSKPLPGLGPGPQGADESVELTYGPGDTVVARARLNRRGHLVLSQQHYPGWQVEVDGRPAKLLRVDYLLMGVALPGGQHTVRFRFRPASFRRGLWLTGISCYVLLFGAFVAMRRKPRLAPAAGAEEEPLVDEPYSRHVAKVVTSACAILLLLGPVLRPGRWRGIATQLDPRAYAVRYARAEAQMSALEGREADAYERMLLTCRWWPESSSARHALVRYGALAAEALQKENRRDEARAIAANVRALAPAEIHLEPQLLRLSAQSSECD